MTWNTPVALILPPDLIYTEGGLEAGVTLNATNTRQAFLFTARANANVVSVFFRITTVTTSQALRVSIQSVDASTLPARASGTVLGATGNGFGTQASLTANTLYEITLSETVAVSAGTQYAIVIEWSSTAGNARLVAAVTTGFVSGRGSVFVNRQTFISGAWSSPAAVAPGGGFTVGLRTDAANWWMPEFALPGSSVPGVNTSYGSANTPDEVGNRIYLPAGHVTSLWVVSDQDGTGTVVMYDDTDNVVVSSTIVPNRRGVNQYAPCLYPVGSVAITEGWYRVTQKPDTTTTVSRFVCAYSASQENGRAMGLQCYLTQRTDNGAWTDTTTSMMMIGVEMEPTFGGGGGASGFSLSRLINLGG